VKKNSTLSNSAKARFIGLDLADKESSFLGIDGRGDPTEEGRVATTRVALTRLFGYRRRCRIAIEAGTHSPWVSLALTEMGHEVVVANPRQVALIHGNKRKSDRIDAMTLARLARADKQLLYPIKHRSKQAQVDLAVLRARDTLVSTRTQLVNHVRGVVKSRGERLPNSSVEAFVKKATPVIPAELRPALEPLLAQIAALSASIKGYDQQIEAMLQRYPATRLLRQVNGVGPLTALLYILTIEEPNRFSQGRDVAAYLGLTPARKQTGESDPELHITKAGDMFLRKILVQAAQYVIGPFGADCDLRRWGLRLGGIAVTEGGGLRKASKQRKKKAVIAVARKLAVLLRALWVNGEVYDPFRQAQGKEAASAGSREGRPTYGQLVAEGGEP
jgi:transposase